MIIMYAYMVFFLPSVNVFRSETQELKNFRSCKERSFNKRKIEDGYYDENLTPATQCYSGMKSISPLTYPVIAILLGNLKSHPQQPSRSKAHSLTISILVNSCNNW